MKKLIVKYLNRQYLFENGFLINDEFFIFYIKEDLIDVFGEDTLNEFDLFNDWLFILFPDKIIKIKKSNGTWTKRTFDSNGKQLTLERSDGGWSKRTFDSNGNELTFVNSTGIKKTFDNNGNLLTFERSDGYWSKSTFDSDGDELTYENSDGVKTKN